MAGTELLSFLHISDLHFGDPPAHKGGAPTQWRRLTLCDGWLGHHDPALQHLSDFLVDPAHRATAEHMVITGDLTACGKDKEFELAKQYIEETIDLDSGETVGLRHKDVLSRSIPGNHDHWPGSIRVIGPRNEKFDAMFPSLPFKPVTLPLPNGKTLTIAGINSDAGIWEWGLRRALARGHFVNQLEQLQPLLGPPKTDNIRALLVHHSPSWTGKRLSISRESLLALDGFIAQYGIAVILTGHIHVPIGRIREVSHKGKRWQVLEARCGTTTQLDELPIGWVAEGTNDPYRFPVNSLLVHRLVDHGRRIDWEVDLHWRRDTGFDRAVALTRPITVWPR